MSVDPDVTTAGGETPPRGGEPAGTPCLVWVSSARYADLGKTFRIEKDESVLGRGSEADFAVEDPGVSRRHAMVVRRPGGECVLVDLQSRNGTYVNGLRVRSAPLREGDKIQMGTATALRFSYRERLEEGEERLRRALFASGVGAWEWNAATGAVAVTGEAERLLWPGGAGERPRSFWEVVHPEDGRQLRLSLEAAVRTGGPLETTCRLAGPAGTRWLEMRGEVFRDETGSPTHVTGSLVDVTERRKVEGELRHYALLFDSLTDAVVVVDLRGEIVDWNGAAERMLGYSRAEARGRRIEDLLPPLGSQPSPRTLVADPSRAGRWSDEVALRRKDGSSCMAEGMALPLRDAEGRRIADVVLYRDVGDRKRLEARLALSDRMASLGTLAAGVAHEINNPLAFVLATLAHLEAELARLSSGAGDPARLGEVEAAMRDTRHGIERIRAIVRDLSDFARGEDPARAEPVDVNRALELSIRMAESHLQPRARLSRSLGEVPPVLASEARLGQVFLNLLVNAAQAMPGPQGGDSPGEVRVVSRYEAAARRVVVEVSDSGEGIAPEHLPRVFDPFFSTRPPGVGSGLGLSICHGIVTSLGGEISIDSGPGRGTTVRVSLPAAGPTPSAR